MSKTSARERETITATVQSLVEPLHALLINDSEVVLHDLSKLPDSIIAISGNLSGRKIGGRATELLLDSHERGELDTRIAYRSILPDGRNLRASTIVIRSSKGEAVLALCINVDITVWRDLNAISTLALGISTITDTLAHATDEAPSEKVPHDIDELANLILQQVVHAHGVPVKYMQKEQKVEIVAELKSRGFFGLREAAERAAEVLQVSRFTIYNYLKEVEDKDSAEIREVL